MIVIECNDSCFDNYIEHHGYHFSENLCNYAISKMKRNGNIITKSQIESYLANANIHLNNNKEYDHVYVANMAKSDFMNSSIENEIQLARYVKDYIDDEDGYEGLPFTRFCADAKMKKLDIDWDDMI